MSLSPEDLCLRWAEQRFNNGNSIDNPTLLSWLTPWTPTTPPSVTASKNYIASSIAVEAILLLVYSFCIYFYFVRLKAKTFMRLVTKDYLDFAGIVVGCAAMNAVSALRLARLLSNFEYMLSFPEELLLAIADFSFIMNNVHAAWRLVSFSFKVASGFSTSHPEQFKCLFPSLNILCCCLALASIVGFFMNLSQDYSGNCKDNYNHLHRTCPWEFVTMPYVQLNLTPPPPPPSPPPPAATSSPPGSASPAPPSQSSQMSSQSTSHSTTSTSGL
jgi:hypothetical protein